MIWRCLELFLPCCCAVVAQWPGTWTQEKSWAASFWMSRGKFLGELCNWRVNHFTAVANASNKPKLNCLGLNSHAYRSWSYQRSCTQRQRGSDPLTLPLLLLLPHVGAADGAHLARLCLHRAHLAAWLWLLVAQERWFWHREVGGDCKVRRGEGGVVAALGGTGLGCLNPNKALQQSSVCRCGPCDLDTEVSRGRCVGRETAVTGSFWSHGAVY